MKLKVAANEVESCPSESEIYSGSLELYNLVKNLNHK